MPIPLIVAGASIAGGAITGVATTYVFNRVIGKKTTKADVATGALLGTVPGLGYVKPGSKILVNMRHLKHIDRGYDTARGVGMTMILINQTALSSIRNSVVKSYAVKKIVARMFPEGKNTNQSPSTKTQSYQQSQKGRGATTKSKGSRGGMTYCKKHRKYDMCGRYNIS